MFTRIICVVIGYVFGLFQTGYLYGRMNHIDIRDYGSGNAGTTNAMRTLGKKAGIITYLGDCLKAVFCAVVIHFLFGKNHPDMEFLLILYGGLGVVLGHNFPFYLKFKGGKGIAATSGVALSLTTYSILFPILGILTFGGGTLITKYVSFGSLLFVTTFFIELVVLGQVNGFGLATPYLVEVYVIGAALVILAYWRHRANISRLIHGTERKIGQKKEGQN